MCTSPIARVFFFSRVKLERDRAAEPEYRVQQQKHSELERATQQTGTDHERKAHHEQLRQITGKMSCRTA